MTSSETKSASFGRHGIKALLLAGAAFGVASAAEAATGSATFDFTFTGFRGGFAWSEPADVNNPPNYIAIGTVNGITPQYDANIPAVPFEGDALILGGEATITAPNTTSLTLIRQDAQGQQLPNVISFTPAASSGTVSTGQAFDLGRLTFTNGAWFGAYSPNGLTQVLNYLNFTVTSHSSTPEFNNQVWQDSFVMAANTDDGDCSSPQVQANNADLIYAAGARFMGSLRVPEAYCPINVTPPQTGSVEILAHFGSLDPVAFANVQGDGFLSSSTSPGPLSAPEPVTWAMMLIGLTGLGWVGSRRRRLGRRRVTAEALR